MLDKGERDILAPMRVDPIELTSFQKTCKKNAVPAFLG